MKINQAQKYAYLVNLIILILVFCLMGFFYMCKARFLVFYSIPTAFFYLFGFILIKKEYLNLYTWTVYIWLTVYMCVTTVCLGYNFGFHLYCMSMIPVIYVTEYLAHRMGNRRMRALPISLAIGIIYIISTGFTGYFGSIYEIDQHYSIIFWIFNAIIVFCFLIIYSNWMTKMVIDSENKLLEMAHVDKLTGLFNRHYMMTKIEEADSPNFVAIADIDSFKQINDTYGHNAGDYVLSHLAMIMNETIGEDCIIGRWGGEEFLVFNTKKSADTQKDIDGKEYMETLRKKVESSTFDFEGTTINVTITIGLAYYIQDLSIDKWIQKADEKLYYGKNNGKNQVVL